MLTREEAAVVIGARRLFARCCGAEPSTPILQRILKELNRMSDTFNSELSRLRDDVAAQSSVISSATAAFRGLAAQIAAAETSAKAAGATDAQVFAISAVRQTLETNTAALAAAIPANTEAATAPDTTTTATNNVDANAAAAAVNAGATTTADATTTDVTAAATPAP